MWLGSTMQYVYGYGVIITTILTVGVMFHSTSYVTRIISGLILAASIIAVLLISPASSTLVAKASNFVAAHM